MLTNEQVRILQSKCEGITSGPWYVGVREMMRDGETVVAIMVGQDVIGRSPNAASTSSQSSDQNFIVACREMVPKLLAERKAISDLVGGDPSVPLVKRVRLIAKSVSLAKQENSP